LRLDIVFEESDQKNSNSIPKKYIWIKNATEL
jgi:hypothetical protein